MPTLPRRLPKPSRFCPRLEALEDRAVPATVTWVAGPGDWSVGANWNTGSKPSPGDDVVINRPGVTITHASGTDAAASLTCACNFVLSGGTLQFGGPSLLLGTFALTGGSLTIFQATVTGTGTLTVGATSGLTITHSTLGIGLTNQGTLYASGGVNLNGNFANSAGATTQVIADGTGTTSDFDILTVANGFTNHGRINLTSSGNYFAALGVTAGTLTVAPDGSIAALRGGLGSRILKAQLNNQGTVLVDEDLTLISDNAADTSSGVIAVSDGDFTVSGAGAGTTFTNAGSITLRTGHTFAAQSNAVRFFNRGAGTITGTGTLRFDGAQATFDNPFTTNGLMLAFSNSSTYSSNGTLTVTPNSTLTASRSIKIDAPLANQGTVVVDGDSNLFGVFSNAAGATLRVLGDPIHPTADLIVVNGFTNDGLIELTSTGGAFAATLTIASGTLVNAGDGTIRALAGTGGGRGIGANLANVGTIVVAGGNLTVSQSDMGNFENVGTIDADGGDFIVNQSGTAASFTNDGSIVVAAGHTFAIRGGQFASFGGGTLGGGVYTIAGTFQFDGAAIGSIASTLVLDGPAARVVDQTGTDALANLYAVSAAGAVLLFDGATLTTTRSVTDDGLVVVAGTWTTAGGYTEEGVGQTLLIGGTLTVGTLVDVQGGTLGGIGTLNGNLRNAAQVAVGIAGSPGPLFVSGNYTQIDGADLYVEIGGATARVSYDVLVVGGTATLDGALSFVAIGGYVPPSGTAYQILTAGAVSGSFTFLDGDTTLFTPTYDPADVTLVAV